MLDTILKTDSRLRVVTPPKHRKALLDAFERSSSSAKAFAAEHGIKYPTFASWIQQRRREVRTATAASAHSHSPSGQPSDQGGASGWVEAFVAPRSTLVGAGPHAPASELAGLSLSLPGGASVVLRHESEVRLAAALLRNLEALTVASPSFSVSVSSPHPVSLPCSC